MTPYFARKALLSKGWADDVRLTVEAGRVGGIATGVRPEAGEQRLDVVIPGLANAHSHAFQRALCGRTERRSPEGRDNFWSWRTLMYALADRLDAQSLQAIAAQAYAEMLESGYTSVAEFHYLHDAPSTNNDAMFSALEQAAAQSGIRLNYVPVLYQRSGFDSPGPEDHQRRFVLGTGEFIEHQDRCRQRSSSTLSVSLGVHSLRAVPAEALGRVATAAKQLAVPLHLHIAEQQAEVEQCIAANGKRPVEWLLDNFEVNQSWCLVHATQMNDDEVLALATSGAVVCLCPSTEANLGDGLFPLSDYVGNGGRIAIGSDSQATINPFEELRWLEYGQRLATQTRNVSEDLFKRVLAGGALTGPTLPAGIEEGASADLVALDGDDPMLLGHGDDTLLDALLFTGQRLPIDRVMVHGDWRVLGGQHVERRTIRATYASELGRVL